MKEWILKIIRRWISEAIGHDAITLGSRIRGLQNEVNCLKGKHDWDDWSCRGCGNVAQIERMKERGEPIYSYRACKHCYVEMPESRHFYQTGELQKNAKEFEAPE